ncbi:MAG TPA: sulfite exporter TauE/SafE family protein [Edaphocola sp.]|nr:sulfite exporter TauE/SafE family protein [Edaphocola sp.]
MNILVFVSSFLLGIGSSLHCLGMCGPLVMAVPFPANRRSNSTKLLYFLGKAIAYGSLGAIIGIFGLKAIWGSAQQYVSIFAGVFILLMVLFPLLFVKKVKFPFQKYFQRIFSRIKDNPKWYHFFQLGFLNGLLPCGMVYIALTAALASGSPLEGFIAMVLFGIGTTPVLWVVAAVKGKITPKLQVKLKPVSMGLSVVVGLLLILRGLGLGIPFISPKMDTAAGAKQACCSKSTAAHQH